MTKILFENSEILQQAKVTIDGVDYPVTPAQMKAVQHYLSAEELNELQDNIENAINEVDNKFNYSTEEQKIGTWIDGKPLYRKVIIFDNFTSASGTKTTDLSSLNIKTIVSAFANGNWANGGGMSYPYNISNDDKGSIAINGGWITLTYVYPNIEEREVYVFLKYTKTTD